MRRVELAVLALALLTSGCGSGGGASSSVDTASRAYKSGYNAFGKTIFLGGFDKTACRSRLYGTYRSKANDANLIAGCEAAYLVAARSPGLRAVRQGGRLGYRAGYRFGTKMRRVALAEGASPRAFCAHWENVNSYGGVIAPAVQDSQLGLATYIGGCVAGVTGAPLRNLLYGLAKSPPGTRDGGGSPSPTAPQPSPSTPGSPAQQQRCADIWNRNNMQFKSEKASVGIFRGRCRVLVGLSGTGADRSWAVPCTQPTRDSFYCSSGIAAGAYPASRFQQNATIDSQGHLTLFGSPTHATPRPVGGTVLDGYLLPFSSSGMLRPGLTFTKRSSGSCAGGSEYMSRPDAWRCFAGNFVLDPCFAPPGPTSGVTFVACPAEAGSRHFWRVELTKPLPNR